MDHASAVSDVVLRDGSTVCLRHAEERDLDAIRQLLNSLSPESRYFACGTGGVLVDVLADTAFRLPPLRVADAREMTDELKGARLLRGYRGAPPADEAALRQVLLRVSRIVTAAPDIQELDLNPVIVLSAGAIVADVRARVEAVKPTRRGL